MPLYKVACPGCQVVLKSRKPLPAGAQLQCPQCGDEFRVPSVTGANPAPAFDLSPAEFPVARGHAALIVTFLVSLLLVGGGVSTVIVLTRPIPAASVPEVKSDPAREDLAKRQRDFLRVIRQGDRELDRKHFDAAARAYEEALGLIPEDADARHGLEEARSGLKILESEAKERAERSEQLARLLKKGQEALGAKRYAAAVQAFEAAVQLRPDDEVANRS